MDSFATAIAPSLLRNIPELLAWGIGIVLGVIMLRSGGGKAEKLFLVGCSLIFASKLASPLLVGLVRWLMSERGMSNIATAQTMGLAQLPLAILSLVALVCLVWAFWLRFWIKRREAA